MDTLILVLGVTVATLFWVLNNWAVRRDARPGVYSFWLLLTSAALTGPLAVVLGQHLLDPGVWLFGGIIGLCYAGCLKLMLYCMQRGPSGPVAAANNMGMIWPVTAAFIYPALRLPSVPIALGALAVCTALVLLGLAQRPDKDPAPADSTATPTGRSSLMAAMMLLWVVAGVSMLSQSIATDRLPDNLVALAFAMNLVACAAVLPTYARASRPRDRRNEVVPGIAAGIVQAAAGPLIFIGIRRLGPQIVFPFVIATPIIIMLMLGHFAYKDALGRLGWAGCLLGALGLVFLFLAKG